MATIREKAIEKVNRAIRANRLVRGTTCVVCDKIRRLFLRY